LLDNKPSNHAPDVDVALGDTIRIRATPERPQNKGHVEGAFGLFSQILPHLIVDTRASAHDLARSFLSLIVDVWTRTTNHRPRKDRAGRSRIDLYGESPTDEQIVRARRELRELADQQERSRRTLEARRRPRSLTSWTTSSRVSDSSIPNAISESRSLAIRRTASSTPSSSLRASVARRLFRRRRCALPARHCEERHHASELEIFAETIYRGRVEARDRFLAPLRAQREELRKEPDIGKVLMECVVQGMATDSHLERTFWLDVIVETLRELPDPEREQRFVHTAHLIVASVAVPARVRQDACALSPTVSSLSSRAARQATTGVRHPVLPYI